MTDLYIRNGRLYVDGSYTTTLAQSDEKVNYGEAWSVRLHGSFTAGARILLAIDDDMRFGQYGTDPMAAVRHVTTQDEATSGVIGLTVQTNTRKFHNVVDGQRKPVMAYVGVYETPQDSDIPQNELALGTVKAVPVVATIGDEIVPVAEKDIYYTKDEMNGIYVRLDSKGVADGVAPLNEEGIVPDANLPHIPADQVQADYDESDSQDVSYIRNKPDLSIYVEKEAGKGLSSNDFTDNDVNKLNGIESGAEVNVQADYEESDSQADSFIQNKPVISTVGHTGSYNDLLDKPHIPEDQVQADYDESDSQDVSYIRNKPNLGVYSLVTETGNKLSMSIDSDYILSISLLDKNDTALSTQTIDLPLEAMIVNASYANGILTLTLQNGNTLEIDISSIISGLVPDTRTVNGHALSSDVTVTASDLGLATVATTGSYDDLLNKPVVEQADWDESDSQDASFIQNKPVIPEDALDYLCFTAGQANSTVKLNKEGSPYEITLEYSTDKINWSEYAISTVVTLANVGDSVWFRGNNSNFSKDNNNYYYFVLTGKINASGTIMSLVDKMCKSVVISSNWMFCYLFSGNSVALVTPPKLTAIVLKDSCYASMFAYSGITKAPELPETLAYNSCFRMFYECQNLTSIVLPQKVLANRCFGYLFNNCNNIKDITVNFISWGTDGYGSTATDKWINASSFGVFRCPSALDCSTRDASHVPAGWTIVRTDAPQSNWDESDSTEGSFIQNKPDISGDISTAIADALTFHNN